MLVLAIDVVVAEALIDCVVDGIVTSIVEGVVDKTAIVTVDVTAVDAVKDRALVDDVVVDVLADEDFVNGFFQ